jgi:hypothetical protein
MVLSGRKAGGGTGVTVGVATAVVASGTGVGELVRETMVVVASGAGAGALAGAVRVVSTGIGSGVTINESEAGADWASMASRTKG